MSTPERPRETPHTSVAEISGMRRRLLRGGLSSAPLLVTLISRPVLAQTCFSPSETLSGTMSHKAGDLPVCSGRSPSIWKTLGQSQWPVSSGTTFHSLFPRGPQANFVEPLGNGTVRDLSLLEVLELQNGQDPAGIGAHFVGAYLNILSGSVDSRAMTVANLTMLWSEWVTSGHYTPYAGARPWYAEDIVTYLASSGIAPA